MYLDDYAAVLVARCDGSPGYAAQLHWTISHFEKFAGRQLTLADLSEQLLNDFMRSCRDRLAPCTRRSRRNMILRLWRFAATDPLLEDRPLPPRMEAITRIKVPQTPVEAWTLEEVRRLYGVAGGLTGKYGDRFDKSAYWQSYILAAWDLGWRGCDLRTFPVAAAKERVKIVQQKTGRVVYGRLRPPALRAIGRFVADDPRELVWPLWCRLSVWRLIARRLVRRAGLPGSIGWLRGAAATACELVHPGKGYRFLGNTPDVFYRHYFDRSQGELPQPPPLE